MFKSMKRFIIVALASCVVSLVVYADPAPASLPAVIPTKNIATLLGAYEAAEKNDPVYQQAFAQYKATIEAKPQAFSTFLPTVGINGTAGVDQKKMSVPSLSGEATQTSNTVQAALVANETLLNFQNIAAFSKSKATVKAAKEQLEAAKQDLILRVSTAYFNVLQAVQNVLYAQANERQLKAQLEEARAKEASGAGTALAVSQARAAEATAHAQVLSTRIALQTAREALRAITTEKYDGIYGFQVNKADADAMDYTPEALLGNASNLEDEATLLEQQGLQGNTLLKADEALKTAAKINVRQAFAGHLPTLSANGSYSVDRTTTSGAQVLSSLSGSGTGRDAMAELVLNVPLFQGGFINSQTRQARANYEYAAEVARQQSLQVQNDASSEFWARKGNVDLINADKQALKASQELVDSFKAQRSQGVATSLDVTTAMTALLAAKQQYANDLFASIRNDLALQKTTGTLGPSALSQINDKLTRAISFKDYAVIYSSGTA